MKNRDKNIKFLMGIASAQEHKKCEFAIVYPDDCGMCYVNEHGEPLSDVPEGMTVIHARSKEQSELWVTLYESMGDGFVVGKIDDEKLGERPVMKITEELAIAV